MESCAEAGTGHQALSSKRYQFDSSQSRLFANSKVQTRKARKIIFAVQVVDIGMPPRQQHASEGQAISHQKDLTFVNIDCAQQAGFSKTARRRRQVFRQDPSVNTTDATEEVFRFWHPPPDDAQSFNLPLHLPPVLPLLPTLQPPMPPLPSPEPELPHVVPPTPPPSPAAFVYPSMMMGKDQEFIELLMEGLWREEEELAPIGSMSESSLSFNVERRLIRGYLQWEFLNAYKLKLGAVLTCNKAFPSMAASLEKSPVTILKYWCLVGRPKQQFPRKTYLHRNEKSCELSLTLAASSSKRPTSLTIQSEHVKKQKTSDASLEPVPASRPALQFLSMFNNTTTSTRDAASDTPPESPPSSSESQATSPSSDSLPLPLAGPLTLTFLAAALSNASLEGAPPGISPSTQAAMSTGEVPVQSGKKKRGPTNPNNLFKPSSGLTTARNLCGIEWQAQRKTGTVAEFTTHWNSLTPQQREPYAKATAAEFAASGPST
ncbi:hypothetical protein EDD22DRAFT_852610 [Suillus occidentalis]|nr:hypothetical protein EDD22DRAFT_852610 [Suillus occidentalis]